MTTTRARRRRPPRIGSSRRGVHAMVPSGRAPAGRSSAGGRGAVPAAILTRPCDCPTSSSPRFATTRPRPRCRRIGCCCEPATSASSGPASIRCCRSASGSTTGSSRSSARSRTESAPRRWRCRSSTRPTSGGRAVVTTSIGSELTRFKDRNGRDMVLAFTHEEVVGILLADLVEVVSPAADAGLPLPDEVARRAAIPWRAHPGSRVRHEGRLQLRPRRGGPGRQLRGPARRVRPDVRAPRARDGRPSPRTSGSWAAARPTSSWSSTRPARTSSSCARRAATRRTARSRSCPSRR